MVFTKYQYEHRIIPTTKKHLAGKNGFNETGQCGSHLYPTKQASSSCNETKTWRSRLIFMEGLCYFSKVDYTSVLIG